MKRALLCLLLLGCTRTKTTAPGPLGDVDFTAKLPASVKAPPESEQKAHEGTVKTCKDAQDKSVEVKVKWWTFEQGPNAYITKTHFELVHADDGFEVALGKLQEVGGRSLVPNAPTRQVAQVSVSCRRQTWRYSYEGSGVLELDVEGKLQD